MEDSISQEHGKRITRRQFLKLVGTSTAAAALTACNPPTIVAESPRSSPTPVDKPIDPTVPPKDVPPKEVAPTPTPKDKPTEKASNDPQPQAEQKLPEPQAETPTAIDRRTLTSEQKKFLANHEILRGDTSKEQVMLTYDDFPKSPEGLRKLLDSLDKHQAKATFFFVGENIRMMLDGKYADYGWKIEDIKQVADRGHEVAVHGWQHETPLSALTTPQLQEQAKKSLSAIQEMFPSSEIKYFRAPFGAANQEVREAFAELGLQHVRWEIESGGDENTVNNISSGIKRIGNGGIILSHLNRSGDIEQSDKYLEAIRSHGKKAVLISDGIDPKDVLTQ